ncbi:MAG TPA: hypothetical protein VIA64_16860 [Burkholderiales bacterium]|jgi:hypothetical protein
MPCASERGLAMEPSVPPQQTIPLEDQPVVSPSPILDQPQRGMTSLIEALVSRTDALFSGDRGYDAPTGSYVALGGRAILRRQRDDGSEFEPVTRVRLNLPRTEERLKLLVDRDIENLSKSTAQRETEVQAGVAERDDNPYLALRAVAAERLGIGLTADAGVRLRRADLDPFVRLHAERIFAWRGWSIPLSETLLWRESDHGSAATELAFLYPLSQRHALALISNATWRHSLGGFDLGQTASLFWRTSERSVAAAELVVIGHTEPQTEVTAFSAALRYRRLLHRDWLVFELRPQLTYPRDKDFRAIPSFTLQLEAWFGSNYVDKVLH